MDITLQQMNNLALSILAITTQDKTISCSLAQALAYAHTLTTLSNCGVTTIDGKPIKEYA
jgi:hypothetical protein